MQQSSRETDRQAIATYLLSSTVHRQTGVPATHLCNRAAEQQRNRQTSYNNLPFEQCSTQTGVPITHLCSSATDRRRQQSMTHVVRTTAMVVPTALASATQSRLVSISTHHNHVWYPSQHIKTTSGIYVNAS